MDINLAQLEQDHGLLSGSTDHEHQYGPGSTQTMDIHVATMAFCGNMATDVTMNSGSCIYMYITIGYIYINTAPSNSLGLDIRMALPPSSLYTLFCSSVFPTSPSQIHLL